MMNANPARKQENVFRIVPIQRTPDELAQLELTENVGKLRLRAQKPRRAAKLAVGELFPLRTTGRLLEDLIRAGSTEADLLQAFVPVVANLIRRKCRKGKRPQLDTGEFRSLAI
jgi:hypothetical protein